MKNLFRLVVFLLLIGGWGLAAMSLHIVRTPGTASREFIVVPKNRLGFGDTYVDARGWTLDDVWAHRSVIGRMIETEKYMALAHVTGETEPAEVRQKLDDARMSGPQPSVVPAKKGGERQPEANSNDRRFAARQGLSDL